MAGWFGLSKTCPFLLCRSGVCMARAFVYVVEGGGGSGGVSCMKGI